MSRKGEGRRPALLEPPKRSPRPSFLPTVRPPCCLPCLSAVCRSAATASPPVRAADAHSTACQGRAGGRAEEWGRACLGLDTLCYTWAAARRQRRKKGVQGLDFGLYIKADDVSRIIEGVVDLQAAAEGLPALRWFIGYDAGGEPMFCGNQSYVTCAHRLDCERCGMFIGGEKARLLHEGESTLPVTSQVPMTPLETCIANGDEAGAQACQAALKQVRAPETPDIRLIFNPEGLSNQELERLAEIGTADALEKLRQALSAHEKKLGEVLLHKTGRSAVVGAQKKRVHLLQRLIPECERRMGRGHRDQQYLS